MNLKRKIVKKCLSSGVTVSTAESCTGGLIAKLLTDVPGSSGMIKGGCVCYVNEVKTGLLGVPEELINVYTEVSEPCAKAMAEGALRKFDTDFALSTTGYAGPGGGTERDPVGTVYCGLACKNGSVCKRIQAPAGFTRAQVRRLAAQTALEMLSEALG